MRGPLAFAAALLAPLAFAPSAAAADDAVSGHWSVLGHDAGKDFTLACVFSQNGQRLSGECVDGPTGDAKIKGGRHHVLTRGSVTGDKVSWTYQSSAGLLSFGVDYFGARQGDHISGQVKALGATGTFTANRVAP